MLPYKKQPELNASVKFFKRIRDQFFSDRFLDYVESNGLMPNNFGAACLLTSSAQDFEEALMFIFDEENQPKLADGLFRMEDADENDRKVQHYIPLKNMQVWHKFTDHERQFYECGFKLVSGNLSYFIGYRFYKFHNQDEQPALWGLELGTFKLDDQDRYNENNMIGFNFRMHSRLLNHQKCSLMQNVKFLGDNYRRDNIMSYDEYNFFHDNSTKFQAAFSINYQNDQVTLFEFYRCEKSGFDKDEGQIFTYEQKKIEEDQ